MEKPLRTNVVPINLRKHRCESPVICAQCDEEYCGLCRTQCPKCAGILISKAWRGDCPDVQDLCLICQHTPKNCLPTAKTPYSRHFGYKKDEFSDEFNSMIIQCNGFALRTCFKQYFPKV